MNLKNSTILATAALLAAKCDCSAATKDEMTTEIPSSITAPTKAESSIDTKA